MAFLANIGECDYTHIKKSLNISDGHMSTHMKKLVSADYVICHKLFVDNKPKTKYKLSKLGKVKLKKYLESLKRIIVP